MKYKQSERDSNKVIFHLARHGETEWNIEHRIQGQLNSALTEKGEAQALELAILCSSLNITQIITSSLGRAVRTASICAQQLQVPLKIVAGLEERDFGVWQGRLTPEMATRDDYVEMTSQVTDCTPERGESAKQLLKRFDMVLKKQLKNAPDENFLVITHGDVLRCFMSQFQGKGINQTGYDYKNGQIISIVYDLKADEFFIL